MLCLILIIGCAAACASVSGDSGTAPFRGEMAFSLVSCGLFSDMYAMSLVQEEEKAAESTETADEADEEEEESRSLLTHILLYLPNRFFDLFDIARAGVSVGPGIGVDLTATKYLNATLMAKASVGLGLQTLRHLPIESAAYTSVGAGPIQLDLEPGLSWYRSPGEIRAELHVLIVGAHAAVDPVEIFDLLVGFFLFDPVGDDF
jgi:hypothetical protein